MNTGAYKFIGRIVAILAATTVPAFGNPVAGQGTWQTTLQARDLDRNGVVDAFYDTELNITWLREVHGPDIWDRENAWANSLKIGGIGNWRLPTMVDTGSPGCDFSVEGGTDCGANVQTETSEMAHLFYVTLGNKSYCAPGSSGSPDIPFWCDTPQPGWGLTNTGDFQGLVGDDYWTGLIAYGSGGSTWFFSFFSGFQAWHGGLVSRDLSLAVHNGDAERELPAPKSLPLTLVALFAALALTPTLRRRNQG